MPYFYEKSLISTRRLIHGKGSIIFICSPVSKIWLNRKQLDFHIGLWDHSIAVLHVTCSLWNTPLYPLEIMRVKKVNHSLGPLIVPGLHFETPLKASVTTNFQWNIVWRKMSYSWHWLWVVKSCQDASSHLTRPLTSSISANFLLKKDFESKQCQPSSDPLSSDFPVSIPLLRKECHL